MNVVILKIFGPSRVFGENRSQAVRNREKLTAISQAKLMHNPSHLCRERSWTIHSFYGITNVNNN